MGGSGSPLLPSLRDSEWGECTLTARSRDRDIEEYRALMERPETFEDGVNFRTVIGAFFIGFIMMPGSI